MVKILTLLTFLTAVTTLCGEHYGRIDINGISSKIELKPVGSSSGKVQYGTWQKPENIKRYLTVNLEGKVGEWRDGSITFIPKTDGFVSIILLGPYVKGGKKGVKPFGVYYDEVKLNGKLIKGGDFENGTVGWSLGTSQTAGSARIVSDKNTVSPGKNCLLSWHNAPAKTLIKVKKGENTKVSFKYCPAGEIEPTKKENVFYPLSLAAVANMGFSDEVEGDGKGGWTDQGPDNDLSKFDPTQKKFCEIPFDISDPDKNNGRSCVIFKSKHSTFGVESITIPVNQTCNTFFFLNACAWAGKKGDVAADAVATFVDGTRETFSFVNRVNTGDWWIKTLPGTDVAWKAGAGASGQVGFYNTVWKLKHEGLVKSLEIRSVTDKTIFALIGVTAAQIYSDPFLKMIGKSFDFDITTASKFTAINLDLLKLKLAAQGVDVKRFFDKHKYLKKIKVIGPAGSDQDAAIVIFERPFSPVILLRTNGIAGTYKLKIGDTDLINNLITPREGLKRIIKRDDIDYTIPVLQNKGILLTADELACSKGVTRVHVNDSFFLDAAVFDSNSHVESVINLNDPMKLQLLAYSFEPTDFRNHVWAEIMGQRIKVGGNWNKPASFYWQGGKVLDVPAGSHKIRIYPSYPKIEKRKNFELAFFLLSDNKQPPYTPTIMDELNALKKVGIHIYGEELFSVQPADIDSKDTFRSIVAPYKSYPNLSYMSQGNNDKNSFMKTDGRFIMYRNGKSVPLMWGCNLCRPNWYDVVMEDRLGENFKDLMMERIKALGYDTVRYMPSTLPNTKGTNQNHRLFPLVSVKPLKFEAYFLKNFQQLVAACHKHNLHLFFTLWHDNCMFKDLGAARKHKSYIGFFHPEAIARLKQMVKLLLTTPNPYNNGVPPVNDPTLSILEIENERNFVEQWNKSNPGDWRQLPEKTRVILYKKWGDFLKEKYQSFDDLKKNYRNVVLRPGFSEKQGFAAVEFPPAWDVREWGKDSSDFNVKMDDLRISEASFGENKKSNPFVSDGLEFMYRIYRDFIVEMTRFLRDELGYKGLIYSNGADTEVHYSQRRAVSEVCDAVSGGTGYWNREGLAFLSDYSWLGRLVSEANNDKPVISREYGPNLVYKNAWWGNFITACAQQYFGSTNFFNFSLGIPGLTLPDYLYPDDSFTQSPVKIDLNQETNIYASFSSMATAIALRSGNIKTPEFKVHIGLPFDNTFYAAPFRGYNKLTIKDYKPFLYAPTCVKSFSEKYDGDANLVVNEPSLPMGDYSSAKNVMLIKPHSSLDRNGNDAKQWFKDKVFQADGFLDTPEELSTCYKALNQAGFKMPVTRKEFCKVWRNDTKQLEIDTTTLTFKAAYPDFGSFIGLLENGKGKMPGQFNAAGKGEAWIFMGNYGGIVERAILMAVMDGVLDIKKGQPLDYVFIGSSKINIKRNGKTLVKFVAPRTTNIGIKAENGKDIEKASSLFVTFFRKRSCYTPAIISLNVGKIAKIEACDMSGNSLGTIKFTTDNNMTTFRNIWSDGNRISYYRIEIKK